jgi:cell fate (sporulation/competence/biofilm development) regulator YmcA (YheA/YmcA/DUF963 family)
MGKYSPATETWAKGIIAREEKGNVLLTYGLILLGLIASGCAGHILVDQYSKPGVAEKTQAKIEEVSAEMQALIFDLQQHPDKFETWAKNMEKQAVASGKMTVDQANKMVSAPVKTVYQNCLGKPLATGAQTECTRAVQTAAKSITTELGKRGIQPQLTIPQKR